jgi:parallel beta-helix repeat protein
MRCSPKIAKEEGDMKPRIGIIVLFGVAGSVMGAASAGAAGPGKITRCTELTKPGSYVVARNLAATGNCLTVRADFVTIDLGGFTISGNDTGAGIIHDGIGRHGIEVRNGTIANFDTGVDLSVDAGNNRIVIEHLRVLNNSFIGILAGDFSIVKDNLVADNGWDGIQCAGNSLVAANISRSNGHDGIAVGFGSTVTGNTSRNNSDDGIDVDGGCTLLGNTATGNGDSGIEAEAGTTLTTDTAWSNTGKGLSVVCPSNLIGNTSTANGVNLGLVGSGCNVEHNLAP